MERWADRVAVVTGASAGIGAAVAIEFATHGMTVIAIARRVEKVQKIIDEAGELKGKVIAMKFDMTKVEEIPKLFQEIREKYGGVDVLVNNAGIWRAEHYLTEIPTEDIVDVMTTNVVALTVAAREAIKDMKERKFAGHIFNMNSIAGHRIILDKDIRLNCYTASKHAVTALTEMSRFELAIKGTNIRMTSISPGVVKTEIFEVGKVDAITPYLDQIPALTSKEVAECLIYVLSLPQNILVQELTIKNTSEQY